MYNFPDGVNSGAGKYLSLNLLYRRIRALAQSARTRHINDCTRDEHTGKCNRKYNRLMHTKFQRALDKEVDD